MSGNQDSESPFEITYWPPNLVLHQNYLGRIFQNTPSLERG